MSTKRPPHPLVQQLTALRYETGLTQQNIAARIGRVQSTVALWEAGYNTPPLSALEAYAAVLGRAVLLGPLDRREADRG